MNLRLPSLVLTAALLWCPVGAAFAGDVFKGKRVYQDHCVGCHGPGGRGALPGTPNFTRGHTLMRSDLVLLDSIMVGKNAMPGFRGVLDRHEMLDVIAYIRTFF